MFVEYTTADMCCTYSIATFLIIFGPQKKKIIIIVIKLIQTYFLDVGLNSLPMSSPSSESDASNSSGSIAIFGLDETDANVLKQTENM